MLAHYYHRNKTSQFFKPCSPVLAMWPCFLTGCYTHTFRRLTGLGSVLQASQLSSLLPPVVSALLYMVFVSFDFETSIHRDQIL